MAQARTGSAPTLTEQELAATSLGLIAQPALWSSLRLPPAAARASTHDEPWTTYRATRLDGAMGVEHVRALLEAACAFGQRGDRVGGQLAGRGGRAEALCAWRAYGTMFTVAARLSPSRETRIRAVQPGLIAGGG